MTATSSRPVTGLEQHLASLGNGRDLRSENELATYRTAYDGTQRTITGLKNAPADLAHAQAKLDDATAYRDASEQERLKLEQQIADAPDWNTLAGRERDKEYDRQSHLRQQLQMLAAGTLLRAPGESFWAHSYADERVRELTHRRDRAQAALDAHRLAAEQLLATTVLT